MSVSNLVLIHPSALYYTCIIFCETRKLNNSRVFIFASELNFKKFVSITFHQSACLFSQILKYKQCQVHFSKHIDIILAYFCNKSVCCTKRKHLKSITSNIIDIFQLDQFERPVLQFFLRVLIFANDS